ncbi:MAG: undecaprenyl-diphosphate phosphatase [Oscillospiraceae bacterium]|nr:undecaprenyl-diphosphate phosphatase [Oscillospiraceae bacterium]
MTLIEAAINGIVQGLTEFLPISSSGHLALIQYFTGRGEDAGMLFTILLHLGTLLAVFIAFWRTIWELIVEFCVMIKDIFTGKFRFEGMPPKRRMIFLIIVSLIPMIGSYFFLDYFEAVSTDNSIITEGVCFLVTSILLSISVLCVKGHKTDADMKYRDAFMVGVAQAAAPMPGISRSGSTISMGLMMGLDREFAVAFSFIIGVPTVLGANVLKISDAVRAGVTMPVPAVLVGVLCALVFGLLAIKMVKWLVASDKLKICAWYTLILGVLVIGIGIFEKLTDNMIQSIVIELMNIAREPL